MASSQPSTSKRAHLETADAGQTTKKPKMVRRRAAIACEECRMRKRRCDGAAPACGACMERMRTCKYASYGQPGNWRGRMIQSLRNQLEELENADNPTPPTTWQQHGNDESTSKSVQDLQRRISSRTDTNRDYESAAEDTVAQHTVDVIRQNDTDRPDPSLSPTREDSLLDNGEDCHQGRTPILLGRSEARSTSPEEMRASCNLERMMEPIIDQITDDDGKSDLRTFNSSLANDKATSLASAEVRSKTADCICDNLLHTRRQWCLPLRRSADTLVTRYFSRHNLAFPILHEQTFRRQYKRLWDSAPAACCGLCKQRSQGKLLLPTTHAIFAYASLFATSQPGQNAIQAKSFFRMAQEVDLLQVLDNEVGIELVQLLLLMGKYLQSTEQLSKFENISGLTIRLAQNMGLHYSVDEAQKRGLLSDPATQLECEMRSRVWYGCVLLERDIPLYLCFGRSLSPAIGDENCPLPEAIDDYHLSDEVGKKGKQPEKSPSALEPFIAMIKLHEILRQALGRDNCYSENASDTSINIQTLLRLDTLIHNWRDALPEHLQVESSVDECNQAEPVALTRKHDTQSESFIPAKKLHLRHALSRRHSGLSLTAGRYLHACQIILRPALELYFKRTQSEQSSSGRRRRHDDLEDLMLTRMAAKCVVSALTIIQQLGAQSEAHIFMAWWFNIAYLHTCGSTILMARMCTFNDANFNKKSLTASWNICLKNLKRYAGVSSIARRSSYLLYRSAERLISARNGQATNRGDEMGESTANVSKSQQQHDNKFGQRLNTNSLRTTAPGAVVQGTQAMNRLVQTPLRKNNNRMFESSEDSSGMASFLDSNLDFGLPLDLDDNFWTGNLELPSWPMMPSIDQLETFPPHFNF